MTIPSPEGQRLPPALPVTAMKSYTILAPLSTHYRAATCEEVACPNITHGFRVVVDEQTDLGQRQAHYLRKLSGRAFTETREAGLTVFTFAPGQRCFTEHRVRRDRPERYFTRAGDWRGNPTGQRPYEHTRPEYWVEDFAENQDRIARIVERG